VRIPYKGLTLVTLRDVTGEIDVAVPDTDSTLNVQPGQSAEATGAVTLYKDTPQVTLARADALSLWMSADSIPVAAPAHVADLTTERAGQWAAVRGQVVKVSPFSAGVRLALDDGTGRANVVLWQDVYAVLSPTLQLTEGAQVAVQGEVSLYRGAVEIVPEIPADVTLVAAAPAPATPTLAPTVAPTPTTLPTTIALTPTAPPPTVTPRPTPKPTQAIAFVPMGQLTSADKGKFVSVRGKIVEVIKFSSGMKYRLDDGTGKVILLLWQEVLDQVPGRDKLVNGAQVSATGEVDVYRGDIEVIPRSGADVKVSP
jgi:DNA/RNA endonuclease YhcR with UshA esterase domain